MKRFVLPLLIVLSLFFSFSATAAVTAQTVGVVNVKKIFESSSKAKSITQSLKSQFASRKEEIVSLSKQLQGEVKKYEKNHSVMDKTSLQTLQKSIKSHSDQLRQKQSKFQADLLAAQNKEMNAFVNEVKAAAGKVAVEKHLTLVLLDTAVVYSKPELDITAAVLEQMK